MILFFWILIQIIGESLPISSSGHVALMQRLMQEPSFEHAWVIDFLLHVPMIIILLIYFFSVWWSMVFENKSFSQDMDPRLREDEGIKRDGEIIKTENYEKFYETKEFSQREKTLNSTPHPRAGGDPCFIKFFSVLFPPTGFVIIADVITFGFWILNLSSIPVVQHYFLPIGFCITAFCLYFSYYAISYKSVSWSWFDAIILGIVQGLALLPGISRFASTWAAGVWLGYDRKASFALSFLIQMPLLCAAFLKGALAIRAESEILQNFMHSWIIFTVVIASLVSYKLFCWVAKLIEQNRLWYFAFYMIFPIFVSLWIVKGVVS